MHTNGKMEETAKSLMNRFCQVQKLYRKSSPPRNISKKADGGLFEMDDHTYMALLEYYQQKNAAWTDYRVLENAEGAKVLTPSATEVQSMEGIGGVKFNKNEGNKLVEYMLNGVRTWGIVTHCLKVRLEDEEDSLVCVRRIEVIENQALDVVLKRMGLVQLKDIRLHRFIPAGSVTATQSYRILAAWSFGYEGPSVLVNVKENIVSECLTLEL
ncbi:uncharacterized protein MELLADRAFT_109002 [Melampsora larici-populina 98AG31]|uniref:Uncharacterized protein n=1 Tax=Melampsora larici-populina (strain 98AG31 / pathotype 3-4-7) TaxID=747676 RepID=F4RV04_MELLP|nr:uncharacterized protein MELLADRAFT_109002 [Melampsora larici-populina 98AG31]EGG03835.1 hypothetical protein MELLADRAFT_109002 [Melampsora larici-populina 98AG31]